VDERDSSRLLTKWFLGSFGHTVHSARSAEQALDQFDPEIHDLVITDNCISPRHGLTLVELIRQRSAITRILLLAAEPPEEVSGPTVFLQRPSHLLVLKQAIDVLGSSPGPETELG
jgi:CheY-like chemotaxis protein